MWESIPSKRSLNTTSLEPLPEGLLEEGDVIEVHQGVVAPRHMGENGTILTTVQITTAETLPRLELFDPVSLCSLSGSGVENVQDIWNDL